MKDLPAINDYRQLLRDSVPLLDVRAPIEFNKGAFPHSSNIPLLSDDERHEIGIEYKHEGHDAAIQLGNKLVQGDIKEARIAAWLEHIRQHPDGTLYCFRGGMRSRITQAWIYEASGIAYPRVEGGYKMLRRYLIGQLEETIPGQINPVVIGGKTGVGKTRLLVTLPDHIDLEGIAHHRGSAFGKYATPQPTQINFENRLAIELIRHIDSGANRLLVEDESRNIGSLHLNERLHACLTDAPLVILEASLEERVALTFDEYITLALDDFRSHYGDESGFVVWKTYMLDAFSRIKRRLGEVRHKQLLEYIETAMKIHHDQNRPEVHQQWIADLLVNYYDPMYDYQLAKKNSRVMFSGDQQAVREFLLSN